MRYSLTSRDPAELAYICQEGEGYLVEFKEKVNDTFARELCAFANASGGRIFVGITDTGKIIGFDTSNKMRSRIMDIANNCQPRVEIRLDTLDTIVVVTVPEGRDKPYQCSDGFFVRMGANSQKMNRDELIDFLQEAGRIRFEEQYHPKWEYARHFDPKKLLHFLRQAGIETDLDYKLILENLGVADIIDGQLKMKNAGVLFFSHSIALLCEQATVTCGVFNGIDRVDIVNRKDFQDDMISNIHSAMHFIKHALRVRYKMTGDPRREEIYEIPLEAIREVIVNAVSHRDYFQYGAHTHVDIFDDRIEISNPGGLMKGLLADQFGKKAVRRNQLIATLLQRVEMVENMGTGIRKIERLLSAEKLPLPKYEWNSFFTVALPRVSEAEWSKPQTEFDSQKGSVESTGKKKEKGSVESTGKKKEKGSVESTGKKKEKGSVESTGKRIVMSLKKNDDQQVEKTSQRILNELANQPQMTLAQLALLLNVSTRSIEKHVQRLKKAGFLRRVGGTKRGYWHVV